MENKYRIEVGNVNVYTDDRTFPIDIVEMMIHVDASSTVLFKKLKKASDKISKTLKIPNATQKATETISLPSKPSGTIEENSKGYTVYFGNSNNGISQHNVIICQKVLSDLYETSKMAVGINDIHIKTSISKSQIALAMKILVWKGNADLTKVGMINYYTPKKSADAHVEVAGVPK